MCSVSIIMSIYRENEDYICKSIDSILHQTFKDFEFIIVLDDPNNSKALSVLKYYADYDSRIKILINENNIGLAMSMNKAANISVGKYLVRMDADDISLPDRLKKQFEYMERNPNISVLGVNKIDIDQNGSIVGKNGALPTSARKTAAILKYCNIIVHSGTIIRKDDFINVSGYRNFPTSQDYDLWLRFISFGYKIANINEYLIMYRTSPGNISIRRAYVQELIANYIRKLHIERIKNNSESDSFSVQEVSDLISRAKREIVDDNSYREGRMIYLKGKNEIKQFHFFKGLTLIIHACSKHALVLNYLRREIICVLIKRA